MRSGTYDYITEMEPHLKALGHDRVWMSDDEPIRWDLVTNVKTGGSWRLGISTSQYIEAEHPSGITMAWMVDLEPHTANGSSKLQLDIDLIRNLIEKTPPHASQELREWLRESKVTIDKAIREQGEYLDRMRQISSLFEQATEEAQE
jgi:hypothetical protein